MKVTAAKTVPSIATCYNIITVYQKHSEEIPATRESIWKWNWFESVSAAAISLAFLLSERIAKELPSAHYLDCELLSQPKPFRVFYINRSGMFLLFLLPQVWEVKFSACLSDEERNEESYQLMVEKRQEIWRGNYPSKKSP